MSTTTLSQEQKDFLEQCEEELKDRYTDKDQEFMAVYSAEVRDPPIVDPWHNRRNNHRDRRHQSRGWQHRRGHRDDGSDRARQRHRDGGGGGYRHY